MGGTALLVVVVTAAFTFDGPWNKPQGPTRIPKVTQQPEKRELVDVAVKPIPIQVTNQQQLVPKGSGAKGDQTTKRVRLN